MLIGGLATVIWDTWLYQQIGKFHAKRASRRRNQDEERTTEENPSASIRLEEQSNDPSTRGLQRRTQATTSKDGAPTAPSEAGTSGSATEESGRNGVTTPATDTTTHGIPVKLGVCIIVGFFSRYAAPFPGLC